MKQTTFVCLNNEIKEVQFSVVDCWPHTEHGVYDHTNPTHLGREEDDSQTPKHLFLKQGGLGLQSAFLIQRLNDSEVLCDQGT